MDPASLAIHDLETVETWIRAVQEVTSTRREHHPYREHDKKLPRPWRLANSPALSIALPIAYFDSIGLPRLFDDPA
jgi:hypothetical protein